MPSMNKIGSTATKVTRDPDGTIKVVYHGTPVVTVEPKGRITLDTGGYWTVTTKNRMNQASNQLGLGFLVWQKNYEWFIDIDGHTQEFDRPVKVIRNGHESTGKDARPVCRHGHRHATHFDANICSAGERTAWQ